MKLKPERQTMENILYALLTDKAARTPAKVEKFALNQKAMEPWSPEA